MRSSLRMVVTLMAMTPVAIVTATACSSGKGSDPAAESGTIGPQGGMVTASDGATIEIPEGALDSDVEISITKLESAPEFSLGAGYRLGPDGQTFQKPVTLTFPFNPVPDRTE